MMLLEVSMVYRWLLLLLVLMSPVPATATATVFVFVTATFAALASDALSAAMMAMSNKPVMMMVMINNKTIEQCFAISGGGVKQANGTATSGNSLGSQTNVSRENEASI
jgi:hypothetical protein